MFLINRCLRFIIRDWWPHNWISNTALYQRCHQKPVSIEILEHVLERKWRWVGYTLGKGREEICKQALTVLFNEQHIPPYVVLQNPAAQLLIEILFSIVFIYLYFVTARSDNGRSLDRRRKCVRHAPAGKRWASESLCTRNHPIKSIATWWTFWKLTPIVKWSAANHS